MRSRFGVRHLHSLLIDLRFGGFAGGNFSNPFAFLGSAAIQGTHYAVLNKLHRRNGIAISPSDTLVDVGCGRGRVINWWLRGSPANRIVGLEIVPDVAAEVRRRLQRYSNVEIISGDAVAGIPSDGTFFYLYNPFDAATLTRFRDRLLSRVTRPEALRILYFNCRHLAVFQEDPRWVVELLDTAEPEPAALIRVAARVPRSAATVRAAVA